VRRKRSTSQKAKRSLSKVSQIKKPHIRRFNAAEGLSKKVWRISSYSEPGFSWRNFDWTVSASLFYHRLQLHTLLWRPFTLHPICKAILSADRPVNSARNCLEVGANNPAEVMSLRVSAVLKYPFSEIKEIGKAAAIHLRSRKRKKLTAALSGIASRLVKWHKLCRNSNLIWSTANATA
jgi:hypothetical protein